jgi:hypothetical protein
MSAMKEEICFMSRSTDASFPVYLSAQIPIKNHIAYLEQGGDGISCDTPVGIGNQVLHVQIASSDSLGLGLGELVECLDSGELEYSLWRGKE